MTATACTFETIVEDPLLSVLKKDSNITKPPRQIRRPGFDHYPTSPRLKPLMINLIPHPEISVLSKVRRYFQRIFRFYLSKKSFQPPISWEEYTPFIPLPASSILQFPAGNPPNRPPFFSPISGGSTPIDQDTRGPSIQAHG